MINRDDQHGASLFLQGLQAFVRRGVGTGTTD